MGGRLRKGPREGKSLVARPFLKWVGGKTQLLTRISSLFPTKVETYYEPFVGGGAVFFSFAEQKRFDTAILSDMNSELINTYQVIRDYPTDLVEILTSAEKQYKDGDPAAVFEEWRAADTTLWDLRRQAARMIFLNKTCFNGLYRVNKSGKFNTPFGKYKNPCICDVENLQACSKVLNGALTNVCDFETAVQNATAGDGVYFDPPYIPLTKTANFTSYQAGGFGQREHERLATLFGTLVDRGVSVVLSNSDTPTTRELYGGFEQHVVPARRAINSKGEKRGPVDELIVVGKRV